MTPHEQLAEVFAQEVGVLRDRLASFPDSDDRASAEEALDNVAAFGADAIAAQAAAYDAELAEVERLAALETEPRYVHDSTVAHDWGEVPDVVDAPPAVESSDAPAESEPIDLDAAETVEVDATLDAPEPEPAPKGRKR